MAAVIDESADQTSGAVLSTLACLLCFSRSSGAGLEKIATTPQRLPKPTGRRPNEW